MKDLFNEKGSSVILTMIRGIFTVGVGSTVGLALLGRTLKLRL
jgi:hypothetical protein